MKNNVLNVKTCNSGLKVIFLRLFWLLRDVSIMRTVFPTPQSPVATILAVFKEPSRGWKAAIRRFSTAQKGSPSYAKCLCGYITTERVVIKLCRSIGVCSGGTIGEGTLKTTGSGAFNHR
jgi:hypothetical protein